MYYGQNEADEYYGYNWKDASQFMVKRKRFMEERGFNFGIENNNCILGGE